MVIVFKKGDNFLEKLKKRLQEKDITSAFFFGLGGFSEADLAYYDLKAKKYILKSFTNGPYEVLNITGNISRKNRDLAIHCHATLSDKKYRAIGGHLKRAVVGGTLELNVLQLDQQLERSHDPETGLYLLK